jgi:alpha-1,6-mannosyltransferase
MGIALGTVCAALAARRVRPERAALAAAIVGLSPVVVVHTVGGGHVDAMVAAPLGAALLLAVFRPPPVRASRLPSVAVTVLLTAAVLIKPVTVPALALWVWWVVASAPPGRRAPTAAFHVAVVAGLTAAALVPFVDGLRTLTPLASLGGVEAWASPSHLVGHGVEAVVGWLASSGAGRIARLAVEGAFLALFVAVCWRMGRRWTASGPPHRAASPADAWGPAFLLLALAMPFLLPWYAAWFVPFLALLRDEVLLWIGVAVTGLLATTLIPADPFRGYTTWAVMAWVHYVVAPLMLLLLLVAARRVLRDSPIRLATMERAVLVYDADCGFCRWSVAKILRWDRRGSLRAVAAQDPEADALLGGMDAERKMASWHLVTPDGRVYSAGAAVRPLWEMLPRGKPVALLARLLPGTTERAYAWVADHRDQLGRRLGEQACSVDPGRQRAS